ncbi:SET domain-containing protein-lysine N-methyltransferase [Aerosticca soli]|jgi:hypothetical protein|uniref:SET domain-containing protein n=1 Tax=Aerosticca soli TaxID=2010829 RepID=A0A2Z6E3Y6_9GAMM|nr:SET domain-containing protein-lysine N-methyltransferase [Aerosticca soli]MDI3261830.1 SET domain-containing protein-lysine N-methyltransferase [Fulvimonas sp.]BBD79703.1 hypothetical protein ALSL_1040 [Aerosticca soli]
MILPRYRIAASAIPGAGMGVWLDEPARVGRVLIAPDAIQQTYDLQELLAQPALFHASARWFEDRYTLSPDWPDECYVNHSFEPTGLWHLGFVFARRDLPAGTEITVDYRHLLPPGHREDFIDAATGETIIGFGWAESLAASVAELHGLLHPAR